VVLHYGLEHFNNASVAGNNADYREEHNKGIDKVFLFLFNFAFKSS